MQTAEIIVSAYAQAQPKLIRLKNALIKSEEFCKTIKIKDRISRKIFGSRGCLFLFTFANIFGKKFLFAMEYSIRTVDIQKPSREAPMPRRQEMSPTTIGQKTHPSSFCIVAIVRKPSCANPAYTSFKPSRPATQK